MPSLNPKPPSGIILETDAVSAAHRPHVNRSTDITNFALIDRVELEFGHGLNNIGRNRRKSILMKAIGFLLGADAKSEYLRDGADAAVIEGAL